MEPHDAGDEPSAGFDDGRRDGRLLAVLASGGRERSTAALARALAARRRDEPEEDDVRRCRVELRHVRLPRLEAAGLVEFDPEAGTVTVCDRALEGREEMARDALADVKSDRRPRRRTALAALVSDALGGEATLTELAVTVVAVERIEASAVESAVEHARTALHHVHVPKLAAEGLVEYDRETRTVTYSGDPTLAASDVDATAAAELEGGPSEAVWTLEGEAEVRERGRALFDHAERELFVLVATEGLLSSAGVDRLAAAAERGADVYVGAPPAAVRDRIREAAPGATVWEPRRSWLDRTPDRGGRLRRLVVADRRAVLVGTLSSRTGGSYGERGVTGDGRRNRLVALARDLLRARLDRVCGDADRSVASF